MSGQPRLLVIGLDGVGHRLLSDWMAGGHLPHLSRFAAAAARAPLRCTWPPHTATGWTTLFTGRLPGQHGHFQFWSCQDPDYRLRVVTREDAGVPSLWDALAAHGWTLGLINIPMSHPPGPWPGFQITWPLTPTLHYIQPPDMARELARIGGHLRPDIACMYDARPDYPARALGYLRARLRAVLHLLRERPADAVAVVFTELDRVCHHYWHAMDPAHPLYDQAPGEHRQVIARTFLELDAAFGELLAAIDPGCAVLVVSDHGFGPGTRDLRLHHLLAEGGLCALPTAGRGEPPAGQDADRAIEILGCLPALDWSRTLAYIPCPGSFGVNLNLAGRQRCGVVRPSQRSTALDRLASFLLDLKDPRSGGPLLSAVIPAGRAFAGPFAPQAPDLLLVPADAGLALLCDTDGPTWAPPGQTGLHRLEGIWMLRADGVAPGRRDAMAAEAVAGDLLAALGIRGGDVPRYHATAGVAAGAGARAGLPAGAWGDDPTPPWTLGPAAAAPPAPLPPADLPAPTTAEEIRGRLELMGYL